MKIRYGANNSGGKNWVTKKDWLALEKAGWKVEWRDKDSLDVKFGWLADYASKDFETPAQAMREFEKITGADVSDEGCNCCGAPHSFRWGDEYVSGEECLEYLYKNVPKGLREACSGEKE